MGLTIGNFEIGKGRAGTPEKSYWNEDDRHARYNAVSDACWINRYRDLEQNLRHFGWRQARTNVLAQGASSKEWRNRGRGDLRLTRVGLQMRFRSGVQTIDWRELKDFIEARRS